MNVHADSPPTVEASRGTKEDAENIRTGFHRQRTSYLRYLSVRACFLVVDLIFLVPLIAAACLSRYLHRSIDVGLGPVPMINSIYHKKCFDAYGYRCETFVDSVWSITDEFDVRFDKYFPSMLRPLIPYALFTFCIFRYRCLYIYFTGGPLRWTTLLAYLEPLLLRMANVRVVVMAFGADVNELTRTKNLRFVDAMARDYPGYRHTRKRVASLIDAWTHWADHIIAGCDWVDYLYYWDTLMLSHFAISLPQAQAPPPLPEHEKSSPLRLLHAPNHRHLKGTAHILRAVEELKAEGVAIELTLVEKAKNHEVLAAMRTADVVVDQLIIGWYAMFAIEGMAREKPVICYLRNDLLDLYAGHGIVRRDEIPLINATPETIKDVIRDLSLRDRCELVEIGRRSKEFVDRFHSIDAVGRVFAEINASIGIETRGATRRRECPDGRKSLTPIDRLQSNSL